MFAAATRSFARTAPAVRASPPARSPAFRAPSRRAPRRRVRARGHGRVRTAVNGRAVTASALRAVSVLSPRGERVRVGDAVGDGRGVLVLLRHLG